MLTKLADVLRNAGLEVVEESGWQRRGHGVMSDVRTIVCHHTGGLKDLRVVKDGRPGLAGPLAQFWLSQAGVWHVVAAGKCWHAGVVRRGEYANEYAIGIEAEATGKDAWPAVQYQSYAKGCAALARAFGVTTDHVLGHKEVCDPPGRKSDPNFDMDAFRDLVQRYRVELSAPRAITPEDDMPTADEVAKAVWQYGVQRRETEDPRDRIPAEDALGYAARWGYAGLTNDKAEAERDAGLIGRVVGLEQGQNSLLELVQALHAKLDALAPPVPPVGG